MSPKAVIKKVKPYPFAGLIISRPEADTGIPVQVQRVTLNGMIVDLGRSAIQPGEHLWFRTEIPVLHRQICEAVRVVHLVHQIEDETTKALKVRLELHFEHLRPEARAVIEDFLIKSGQAIRR